MAKQTHYSQQSQDLLEFLKSESSKCSSNINLANRNLTDLVPEISSLTNLERIALNNNKLVNLPIEMKTLTHLRYINLRSNSLKEFPVVILSISKNRIVQLPKYISQMTNLKVFKIEHNPLTWPPLEFLQPEQEDQEVWLRNLRDYLSNHDPPPVLSTHLAITSPSVSAILSPLITNNAFSALNCRSLVHTFLATYQAKLSVLIAKDPVVDVFVSILYVAVEIYQITNAALLLGTLELQSEINHLNQAALVVLKLLKECVDGKQTITDVKTMAKMLLTSTKDLVKKLLTSMLKVNLFSQLDPRLIIGMATDWSKIIEVLQKSLKSIGLETLEPSDGRFEYLISLLEQLHSFVSTMEMVDQNSYERTLLLAQQGDPKCLEWLLQFLTSCKNQKVLFQHCSQLALEAQHLTSLFE